VPKRASRLVGLVLACCLAAASLGAGRAALAASGGKGSNPGAPDIISAATTVETDAKQVAKDMVAAVKSRSAVHAELTTQGADLVSQQTDEQQEESLPLSSPPLCTQVRSVQLAYGVEGLAFSRVQQDESTFDSLNAQYQSNLAEVASEVIQLSGDIDNLVATIAQYKGYKMPKIPVELYGKDNVKDLVKVGQAFLKASNIVPDTLAEQEKTLMTRATAVNQDAQKVDAKASSQGCTGP